MEKKINVDVNELKDKSKGFIHEFKEFVSRGNVMDMAVGVIIGAAFSDVVTALTKDIINPLINGIGGAEVGGSIKIYGGQRILYGDFITSIINFFIMAFVLFLLPVFKYIVYCLAIYWFIRIISCSNCYFRNSFIIYYLFFSCK